MFFGLMLFFSLIPFITGVAIYILFERTRLAKTLFVFLVLVSIWQLDVAILYSHQFFSLELIDFLFRLFRFGTIMLTPALLYVAYVMVTEEGTALRSPIVKLFINRKMIATFFVLGISTYLVGWSQSGIERLYLVEHEHYPSFLFPLYGNLSWIFHVNIFLFISSMVSFLLASLQMNDQYKRMFMLTFLFSITLGYGIGILNIFERSKLLPSLVAVNLSAITILIAFTLMHNKVVNKMNRSLLSQREFLRKTIDLNPNYIYAKNDAGMYTLANQSYAKLFGRTPKEIINKREEEVNPNISHFQNNIKVDHEVLEKLKEKFTSEEMIKDVEGKERWIQSVKIPIVQPSGKQILNVSTDITYRKNYEDTIKHQAYHDALTGLPNRRLFNIDLATAITQAEDNKQTVAILFLDLDRFKIINDTLNHNIGDILLQMVAERLSNCLRVGRKSFSVYRIGGDEFTFIVPDCSPKEVKQFARKVITIMEKSFRVEEHDLFVTPSIGISMFPKDGTDVETLIKNADTAMYYVKENGKNDFQFYSSKMNQEFERKMMLEKELRVALENKEFELFYQPQIDVDKGQIIGAEALIRWMNPTLGFISPGEFIPLAEETGLILPIGEWILYEACMQAKRWSTSDYPTMHISVNISIRQFSNRKFIQQVKGVLNSTGLDPKLLVLEITESIAMADTFDVIEKLKELSDLGVRISMDDFGTGYSSLSYLNRFPLHSLKIDQSFVRDISNHNNTSIITTIISMAANLKLGVVAEGVENEEQLEYLRDHSCFVMQGYLFSRPLPIKEFESYLEEFYHKGPQPHLTSISSK